MEDKSSEETRRLIRHMKDIFRLCKRSCNDTNTLMVLIFRLVNEDIRDKCPDHYEEVMALMNRFDGVIEFQLSNLNYLLRLANDNHEYMPNVQKHTAEVEDLRKSLQDMRLNLISWLRAFEGWPTETEKLEMMMSKPSAEEEATEKAEAYPTGGASLLI